MSFVLSKKDRIKARIIRLIDNHVEMVNQSLALTPGSNVRTIVPTYTQHAPLLVQLADASPRSTAGGCGSGPGSKPAANLVPIDTLVLIKQEAAAWVRYYFRERTGKVGENLRLIYERLDLMNDGEDLHQLDIESKGWVNRALIATAWECAPARPYIECPSCAVKGGLRLHHEEVLVVCLDCGDSWEGEEVDSLHPDLAQAHATASGVPEGETAQEPPKPLHIDVQIA